MLRHPLSILSLSWLCVNLKVSFENIFKMFSALLSTVFLLFPSFILYLSLQTVYTTCFDDIFRYFTLSASVFSRIITKSSLRIFHFFAGWSVRYVASNIFSLILCLLLLLITRICHIVVQLCDLYGSGKWNTAVFMSTNIGHQ